MLNLATTFSFLAAPIIAFINFKAIQSKNFPESHRPPKWMIGLAYVGFMAMVGFAIYYITSLVVG